MRRVIALSIFVYLVVLASGCGGDSRSLATESDIASLRPGVDPRAEADAVAAGLERSGFAMRQRFEGVGYVAFDAIHRDRRTAIRVISRRGIAVALDVSFAEREQAISLRLIDGLTDLVVVHSEPALDRKCLILLRVHADGRVVRVPLELGRFGDDTCVEEVVDVAGDQRPELLTHLRIHALSRGEIPTITAILEERGEGYSPAPPSAYREFWAEQWARVVDALAAARRALDFEGSYLRAVELAAIARESGGTPRMQLGAFDEALIGLVLTEAQAQGVADARAHIGDGWPD